jgi:hypothetical protein
MKQRALAFNRHDWVRNPASAFGKAVKGKKNLIRPRFQLYRKSHALDYRCDLAHIVASRFLVSCWWKLDSYYFGDRRDRSCNQAGDR